MHVVTVQGHLGVLSETFLAQQASGLPSKLPDGRVTVLANPCAPETVNGPVARRSLPRRAIDLAKWAGANRSCSLRQCRRFDRSLTVAAALRQLQPDVVLANYGPVAVTIAEGCRRANVPLVVHFHGFDASMHSLLDELEAEYRALFDAVPAAIVVSAPMRDRLFTYGATPERTHLIPYGVDPERFTGAAPSEAGPTVVAVGRLVAKKAPDLLLRAFSAARRSVPEARLRIVGDGELLPSCRSLAVELGVAESVDFLGSGPPEFVRREMQAARLFAQHSVTAPSGDQEGSPVAITEAAMCGLPVVLTRHAGIPALVEEGRTGFLSDEGDVDAFAQGLVALLDDPALAGRMGTAARRHALKNYHADQQLQKLADVLMNVAEGYQRKPSLHPAVPASALLTK